MKNTCDKLEIKSHTRDKIAENWIFFFINGIPAFCAWFYISQEDRTLRKQYFHFFHIEWDMIVVNSFHFEFESNGILFGSKSKGKLAPIIKKLVTIILTFSAWFVVILHQPGGSYKVCLELYFMQTLTLITAIKQG